MNIEPNYLRITSATLIIPFSFYMNNSIYRYLYLSDNEINQTWEPLFESCLATILFATIYASQVFWNNPIKNSLVHRIDGVIAKITIVSFLIYVIAYKERWRDPVLVSFGLLLFYFIAMSHLTSSNEWCSSSHLFYHGGLHLVSSCSAIYAFI